MRLNPSNCISIFNNTNINIVFVDQDEVEDVPVFISYQWESQSDVIMLRERVEEAGFSCWMDVGQMGAGDQLYARIEHAIRQAKVCTLYLYLYATYVIIHAIRPKGDTVLFSGGSKISY